MSEKVEEVIFRILKFFCIIVRAKPKRTFIVDVTKHPIAPPIVASIKDIPTLIAYEEYINEYDRKYKEYIG